MLLLASDNPTDHVTDKILLEVGGVPVFTMHMVTIIVVSVVFVWAMIKAAGAIATGPESQGNERYITKGRFAQMVEAMVVFLRTEMLVPVLGEAHTRRYMPYLLTLFFFLLFNNLFGLVPVLDLVHLTHVDTLFGDRPPIGGTATSNIMVTGALAFLSFLLIQIHGFRDLGFLGWLEHQTGGLSREPWYIWPVMIIVVPVELAGHFVKPMALAIRLFANMFAGHTLMAVLLGFGGSALKAAEGHFTAGVAGITLVSAVAAVLITFLEVFVAFLQAFIFMFLTAVFISLLSHHEEEHAEHGGHEEAAPEAAAV